MNTSMKELQTIGGGAWSLLPPPHFEMVLLLFTWFLTRCCRLEIGSVCSWLLLLLLLKVIPRRERGKHRNQDKILLRFKTKQKKTFWKKKTIFILFLHTYFFLFPSNIYIKYWLRNIRNLKGQWTIYFILAATPLEASRGTWEESNFITQFYYFIF